MTQAWNEADVIYISSRSELSDILEKYSPDLIIRIVYIWVWRLHISSHVKNWDILLPNTFLSKNTWEAFYIEYAVWENFDLEKFVLHLDGVCTDEFWEVSEEYDGDIEEAHVYKFLHFLETKWLKDRSVVILWTENSPEHLERIAAITDMVCAN